MNFYSNSYYVSLPTLKRKKVELAIDNVNVIKNSFKLYRPFTLKAKLLKTITYLLVYNFGFVFRIFIKRKKKSILLDDILNNNEKKISSIYYSRDYSKVVLQVQTVDGKKVQYVKIGLNNLGQKRISNEHASIEYLKKIDFFKTDHLNKYMEFNSFNCMIMNPVLGKTNVLLTKEELCNTLFKFTKNEIYNILEHPFILETKQNLVKFKYFTLLNSFNNILQKYSLLELNIVFMHGDMAPWNIFKSQEKIELIDFELSTMNGISNIDIISYYYQLGNLIRNKNNMDLYTYVKKLVSIKNFNLFLFLYLINIIIKRTYEEFDYAHELTLFNELYKKEFYEV